MRKRVINWGTEVPQAETPQAETPQAEACWFDLQSIAQVEVTSEDPRYPIEAAFDQRDRQGWRAATTGQQIIRIFFDEPQSIRRVSLRFEESKTERTQQFSLDWSKERSGELLPLFRQQWNFSPGGSRVETEDYRVALEAARMLQLVIVPDISRSPAIATLASWRVA